MFRNTISSKVQLYEMGTNKFMGGRVWEDACHSATIKGNYSRWAGHSMSEQHDRCHGLQGSQINMYTQCQLLVYQYYPHSHSTASMTCRTMVRPFDRSIRYIQRQWLNTDHCPLWCARVSIWANWDTAWKLAP